MKPAAIRFFTYGQICFYLGLALAIIIRPAGLTLNQGISYYGIYASTILPYIFALLGSAYFCIKTAEQVSNSSLSVLRWSLTAMGLFIVGVMVTPDSLSTFMDGLHRTCGISLFVIQLLLSLWLIYKLRYAKAAIAWVGLELVGGIAAFIWLAPPTGLLLEAQVVFQLGFAGLMLYALPKLVQA